MVAPVVIGAGISAGASLLGGILGDRAADRRNEQSLALAREQMAMQREFAQMGVRWKVADAKAAGLHPLYALGGQTHAPSPVSVMQESSPLPGAISDMGQDIGRAVAATSTAPERANHVMEALSLERAQLENDLLRSQIARNNSAQLGPPFPSAPVVPSDMPAELVGGKAPRVSVQPLEPIASDPRNPAKEAGFINDYSYARTASGGLKIVPSSNMKERMEDDFMQEMLWMARNNMVPNWNPLRHAPDPKLYPPGKGRRWEWDHLAQEYRSVPNGIQAYGRID